ncbi:MAG TPA: hypothetical protein DCS48_11170 [Desulfovibrio sp.]|nr:hypothetical protein [Desulfovibrio sp.]
MLIKKYPVLLFKDEGCEWGLTVYDLPINLMYPTVQECLDEVQGAIEEFMVDESELAEPSDIETAAMSELGQEAKIVTIVEVDTSFFHDPSKPKTLSAKQSEWEMIDKAAKAMGKTRSAFLVDSARKAIEDMTARLDGGKRLDGSWNLGESASGNEVQDSK